jgi:SAM-dependent methyltransferase
VVAALPFDETKTPEFERYASSYQELIDDPRRNRFAQDPNHFHTRKWLVLKRLLRRLGVDSRKLKWLDVGCGHGELLEIAGASFALASGCDPAPSMLPSDASFRVYEQPSQVHLPFKDQTWDLVTAVCVFHHVHGRNRTLLLNEIHRVLRPGGLCCIFEHNPWNPVTRSIVRKCPLDVEASLLTAAEVSGLVRASGFVRIWREYFLYLPERLYGNFASIERMFSRVPLGGQYVVVAEAPWTSKERPADSEIEEYSTVSSQR